MLIKLFSDHKKHLSVLLFVFFIFSAGYVLQYGREAHASGSWKYIMNHMDDWLYWALAEAHAQAPEKRANPFFYEERDSFQFHPCPTTQIVGALARLLGVSVLFFFPWWHIGAPFLVWLALFLSARYFWKYPFMPAAAVTLLLCLVTLNLKGLCPFILTRFSRPPDFLWAAILCTSLIMRCQKPGLKASLALYIFTAVMIWMNPTLAVTGLIVIFLEMLWQAFAEKNRTRALWLGSSLVFFFISAGIYFLHTQKMLASTKSAWFTFLEASQNPSFWTKAFPALVLFWLVAGMVLGLHFYEKRSRANPQPPITVMERLVLYVFLLEPLLTLAYMIFPTGAFSELERHRYVNFLIQFAVFSAWAWESFQRLKDRDVLKRILLPLILVLAIITGALLSFPKSNFLLLGARELMFDRENSCLLLSLICPIFLVVLLIGKYPVIKRGVQRRAFIVLLSMILCFTGFAFYPSNMRTYNERYPFDGAYAWLKKNAAPGGVVLIPSVIYSRFDYLVFYTGLRGYANDWLDQLSADPKASEYRKLLIFSLLNGVLDKAPLQGRVTLEEKIRHLRMDYVLIPRWSPFLGNVERQLAGHLTRVYEDKRAILWKIS